MPEKEGVLCKIIADRVEAHTKRLENHGERIERLERFETESITKMNHVLEKLEDLKNTIMWFTRTLILIAVGFIVWYIQAL